MGVEVDLRVVELLCGRLCHELISPVGAINNGVELLSEDDPEFVKEAMGLIGQSARKAGQRLQFYRFAYGTSGASGVADPRELSLGLFEGSKLRCDWAADANGVANVWQRLACNMLVLAAEFLPRGGTVRVRPLGTGVEVAAEGDTVNVSAELAAALEAGTSVETLTARSVHAFYTMRLAQQMGARLALAVAGPGRAVLTASPAG
ncbi:MAG TPA: histidine phosphotransferase family protein [Stellaceae bacterium]|nr:histidine phosphotransferase family protein [Stellaceae bacterium]